MVCFSPKANFRNSLFDYQSLIGVHIVEENLDENGDGVLRAASSVPWSKGPAGDGPNQLF